MLDSCCRLVLVSSFELDGCRHANRKISSKASMNWLPRSPTSARASASRSLWRRNRLGAAWVVQAPVGLAVMPAQHRQSVAQHDDLEIVGTARAHGQTGQRREEAVQNAKHEARETQHIVPGQHSRPNIGHPQGWRPRCTRTPALSCHSIEAAGCRSGRPVPSRQPNKDCCLLTVC